MSLRSSTIQLLALASLALSLAACPGDPEPACKPAEERCDAIDNDCDGEIDEGCEPACPVGVTECVAGRTRACVERSQGPVWLGFVDCPSGACADAAHCLPCANDCAEPGEAQCLYAKRRTCEGTPGCTRWSDWVACDSGFCEDATTCGGCANDCSQAGATRCADGLLQRCAADSNGCLLWSAPEACGSGFCADASSCGGCENGCPAAGQTSCANGKQRTCVADANGCLAWGPEVACADGFCLNASACGSCQNECPAVGQTSCANGKLRTCAADANGCLAWGPETSCADGFCASATSCGECSHGCPAVGATECSGDSIRSCVADARGCRSWGPSTACASGFCASATACGACNDACPAGGRTECSNGRIRTCVADANGCLAWSSYSDCADGFCADAATCGTCSNECSAAGATQCSGGQLRACQADSHGCLAWSGYSACADGFCASATSCGVCGEACPSEGATDCVGASLRTCQLDVNGCLAWSSAACPAEHTCDGAICAANAAGNDTCAQAQPLTFYGDTAVALGTTLQSSATTEGTCGGRQARDKVYSFNLTSPRSVTVTATSYAYSGGLSVYIRKSCDSTSPLDEVACSRNPAWSWSNDEKTATASASYLAPGTYYVWIDGMPAGFGPVAEAGSYRLEVVLGTPQPPPANDVCAGAQALQFTNNAATVNGSTLLALNDAYGACGGRLAPDVVYSFTLTSARAVEARVTSRTYGYSPVLRLASSCEPTGEDVVCRSSPNSGGSGAFATFNYTYLAPGTYYLWIDGNDTTRGDFRLEVTLNAPIAPAANDTCDGAEPLSFVGATAIAEGSLYGARPSGSGSCGGDLGNDVVYTFTTASARSLDVDLVITGSGGTGFETYRYGTIYLRSSCDDRASELACSQGQFNPSSFFVPTLPAGTYYLWVDNSVATHIDYRLEVRLGDAHGSPANDSCQSGAHLLAIADYQAEESACTVYGTTYEAARDHTTCSASATFPEVVFAFTAEYSMSHSIKLVSSTDMALWVSEGTCGGTCLQFVDSIASGGTEFLHLSATAGRTYYVYVGGAQPGEFTIVVKRNTP
ncbi:MAG: hypothetical protein ACOX6T_22630 [Myxococcales bacterium]|jgi:hypothetical protein